MKSCKTKTNVIPHIFPLTLPPFSTPLSSLSPFFHTPLSPFSFPHTPLSSLPPSCVSDTVMKSCSYKAFCDKAHSGNSGAKMECCFTDDCNGPHKGHQHGEHKNTAGALGASPALLLGALMLRMALSRF